MAPALQQNLRAIIEELDLDEEIYYDSESQTVRYGLKSAVEEGRRLLWEPACPKNFGRKDLMVVAAFRYCLGRKTYIVGDCADWLIEQWPNFSDNAKAIIKRDLEEAFLSDDETRATGVDTFFKPLGMDCDREQWERVRALWHPDNSLYAESR